MVRPSQRSSVISSALATHQPVAMLNQLVAGRLRLVVRDRPSVAVINPIALVKLAIVTVSFAHKHARPFGRSEARLLAFIIFVFNWPERVLRVLFEPSAMPSLITPGIRPRPVILTIMMTRKGGDGQSEHCQTGYGRGARTPLISLADTS
jgi:hypothetical protein